MASQIAVSTQAQATRPSRRSRRMSKVAGRASSQQRSTANASSPISRGAISSRTIASISSERRVLVAGVGLADDALLGVDARDDRRAVRHLVARCRGRSAPSGTRIGIVSISAIVRRRGRRAAVSADRHRARPRMLQPRGGNGSSGTVGEREARLSNARRRGRSNRSRDRLPGRRAASEAVLLDDRARAPRSRAPARRAPRPSRRTAPIGLSTSSCCIGFSSALSSKTSTRGVVSDSARLAAVTIALDHACALNQTSASSTSSITRRPPVMPSARPGSKPITSATPAAMKRPVALDVPLALAGADQRRAARPQAAEVLELAAARTAPRSTSGRAPRARS